MTCIRAEMIREAKEDIELTWLLRHGGGDSKAADKAISRAMGFIFGRSQGKRVRICIAGKTADIPAEFVHYTKRDEDIQAARRAILSALTRAAE